MPVCSVRSSRRRCGATSRRADRPARDCSQRFSTPAAYALGTRGVMPSPYLVVATILKNEAPFLAEWVAFHRLVGVDHLYLYDNGSTDNPEASLAPFLDEGCVTLVRWPIPYHQKAQDKALTDCLNRVRGVARWLACIDVDEFYFHPVAFVSTRFSKTLKSTPGWWRAGGTTDRRVRSTYPLGQSLHVLRNVPRRGGSATGGSSRLPTRIGP